MSSEKCFFVSGISSSLFWSGVGQEQPTVEELTKQSLGRSQNMLVLGLG